MTHRFASLPSHLSIFVTDPETGRPVQHLPIYAEVAVPKIIPRPPINEGFREPISSAIFIIDPDGIDQTAHNRIESAALEAIAETFDDASRDQLITDPNRVHNLFRQVFKQALDSTRQSSLANIPADDLKPQFVAALRRLAHEFGLRLSAELENKEAIWADPLGVLTTDHVGYVSFDLRLLRTDVQILLAEAIEKRRANADAELNIGIWVFLYGNPEKFDVLRQARFAADAVVARLSMIWHTLPPGLINMGPRALQNPSLTDWRLSPASFAASPKSLLGADGCEELLPANLALQEFVLRQVVRLTDVPPDFGVPPGFKAAYVDDYKVSWFSLGHSLGEILYSLPLAPGETVKLAVIDWSWDSLTKRDETTKLTENILHQTHRDRTITETVKAGLKELQQGSSFMAGMANAVGGSGSANLGKVGIGAAVGNTWSIGGSTASSTGSRDLVAENVQRVNDSFSQASTSQRELNSTVVVQARQEEKESIQTRTFSNYNHSHTLTILYYEVLRHYRVTVEWVRRRPAVLLQKPARIATFDAATLIGYRYLLEPNLLDQTLKIGFDALEKQESIRDHQFLHNITPSDAWTPQFWEGDLRFEMFEIGLKTNDGLYDKTSSPVVAYLITAGEGVAEKKYELHYVYKGDLVGHGGSVHNLNSGKPFDEIDWHFIFVKVFSHSSGQYVSIRWADIVGFQFEKWGTDEWRIDKIVIGAFGFNGLFVPLTEPLGNPPDPVRVVSLYFRNTEPSSQTFTWIKRPGVIPSALPPANRSPEKSLSQEERHQITRLSDHVTRNKDYYNRIILLGTDPTSIAIEMEGSNWAPGQIMADYVDPTPLEVFGSYVAYPLAKEFSEVNDVAAALIGNDPMRRQWAVDKLTTISENDRQTVLALTSSKSERLITLPTRGVFAEGKLGHCNISEEIDNTRFWKWEEHPIPVQAPDINPITPITPQPQQVTAAPTPFPQSLVNIVNPSAAPDPTGLSAALSLLGTPNIFRDMSGKQEVADLLKKLSDNSISISEAANRAREIQAKYGSAASSALGSGGVGSNSGIGGIEQSKGLGAPRTSPSDRPSTTTQDLKDLQHVLGSAEKRNLITPEAAQDVYTNAVKGAYDPEFVLTGGAGSAGKTTVPVSAATDQQLNQAALVEFSDARDVDNYFLDLTGKTFAGWFSSTLAGRGSWSPLSMSVDADTLTRFAETWDAFPPILGTDRGAGFNGITLPEFATLMAKFLHETGGKLQFRGAENVGGYGHSGLSYAFDSFVIQRPGEKAFKKGSYNTGNGNHTAFECFHDPAYLAAFGTLEPTDQATRNRTEWKGSKWPIGIPTGLDSSTAFIQEADFYKFRGRGAIQSTGRVAYLPIIDFVRNYAGADTRITTIQQRWNNMQISFAAQGVTLTSNDHIATVSSNADWDSLFGSVTIQAVAIRGHNGIPGKQYLPMSNSGAVLRGTSRGSAYFLAISIAGDNPSYGNDVRQRMVEFIGTLWSTPLPHPTNGATIEL